MCRTIIRPLHLTLWIGVLTLLPAAHAQDSVFGTSDDTQAALIGILYDLKQTQQGEKSDVREGNYRTVIGDFLRSNWDEGLLNRYFRVSRPVYATRVFIPMIPANQAPRAFGVAEIVNPKLWLVHYKGQVVAPLDGVYRFAGFADDILAVAVNGETVLVSGRPDCIPPNFDWKPSASDGLSVGNGSIRYGDWLSLRAGDVIDLDVLIGERPGGGFGAWLYIQRRGEEYPMAGGNPILPAFQLTTQDIPDPGARHSPPRESSVWKALQ